MATPMPLLLSKAIVLQRVVPSNTTSPGIKVFVAMSTAAT